MGVTGLWRLIEPSGKPTPLETLENKVLAVDISIWLHQAIKGFQDVRGAPLPNAHLLGIYHRVCKLLYYRIKPVFIFDGGVPNLKKETIAKRSQLKSKKLNEADRIQKQLLNTILKHSAVSKVISEKTKACIAPKGTNENMYELPSSNINTTLSSDEEDTSKSTSSSPVKQWDLHTIDEKSPYFKSLPADVRHEILTDLKETRKQSSWGRLHELPKQSDDFAGFQMKRLLKRYSVQVSLEEAEKEMGGKTLSLSELEALLKDQGVVFANDTVGARIASDEHTRYVLIKNVQEAMDKDKRLDNIEEEKGQPVIVEEINEQTIAKEVAESKIVEEQSKILTNNGDIEFQNDLQRAIQLSLQDVPSTSKQSYDNKCSISFLDADISRSSESEEECNARNLDALSSAKNYMTEYSGLTPNEVAKVIGSNLGLVKKNNGNNKKLLNTLTNIEKTKELHCEEISSTSRSPLDLVGNDKSKEQKKEAVIINEVEVMSDSSDSSIEFLDVNDNQGTVKETKQLEIVIKPEDALEDDIFEDIFNKEGNPTTTTTKEKINSAEQVSSSTDTDAERNKDTQDVSIQEPAKSIVAEFIKETNGDTSKVEDRTVLTTEQLQKMEEDLRLETAELFSERLSKERMANNLTDQIYQEVQELLQLFGVPYIVAPMEAEAQCAFLDEVNLTDGTITDDSDIWLFGGKTVYKNFFNQQKLVMKFQLESIQCHFKLTREQMILLALLVGSDYTNGLQGVGPVTALEILAAFPPSKTTESQLTHEPLVSGLRAFRNWLSDGLNAGLGKNTLKSKLKNVLITESFPSLQVVKAYLEPTIDSSEESFSWAKPDIPGLIEFAKRKFGWPQVKSEAILKPVLKRINEPHLQKTIKEYFQTKRKIDGNIDENKMSKRVKKAIARIGVERGSSSEDDVTSTNKRNPKSKRNPKNLKSKKTVENVTNEVHGLSSDEDVNVLKKVCSQSEDRLEQINSEIKYNIKQQEQVKKVRSTIDLHKKESIPQKEKDKIDALRSKMKAIEVFRKSKKGPGYVKKRKVIARQLKEDAGLSDDSSSD